MEPGKINEDYRSEQFTDPNVLMVDVKRIEEYLGEEEKEAGEAVEEGLVQWDEHEE